MLLKLLQVHWTCMTMRATISWCSFIHTWQAPSQQPVALQLVRCKYTVQSMSVTLSQPSQLTSQIFLDSLKDWQHPPDSQCGRRFSNKPAEGIPFNEDVTFDEHGNADSSWHCTGMRVSSHCLKLNLKSFFVFSVVLLCRGGNLYSAKLTTVSTRPRFLMNCWHFFDTFPRRPDDKVGGDSLDWYLAQREFMWYC